MNNLSIKKLLFGIATILVAIYAINVAMVTNRIYNIDDTVKVQEEEILPQIVDLFILEKNVIQVQQWLTDISATRAAEGYDDGFDEAKKYYEHGLVTLDKLIKNNKNFGDLKMVEDLENFKTNFESYYKVGQKMANAYIKNGHEEGNKVMEELDPFAEKLSKQLETWIESNLSRNEDKTKEVYETLSSTKQETIITGIVIFVFIIIMFYILISKITKSLDKFQVGLNGFFKYLNKEIETAPLLEDKNDDEISKMARVVNTNIKTIEKSIEDDRRFLNEVSKMVEEIKKGYLFNRFENKVENESLEALRQNFNEMLENLQSNIAGSTNKILNVLLSFGELNFKDEVKNDNGKIAVALRDVAKLITEMLTESKATGLTLQQSSKLLLNNVEVLSGSSNDAAARLEETAAALEEISSNITNNTNNIIKMSSYANELTKSATEGHELANETTISMDEINTQVNAINEAISVIDQIAFQTNILSLNAAVEAATAGEAGKGFAVVAQEVRNLASRSAEAAKEIKDLVETATNKADNGKQIASKMIHGYNGLNENISKTIDLMKDIESASKEQQQGIEQINSAVNELDKKTQENASIAMQTQEVAVQTQNIAHEILIDADKKEFFGKESVKAKELTNNQTTPVKPIQTKKVETSSKKENTYKPTTTTKEIKTNTTDDDEWESF